MDANLYSERGDGRTYEYVGQIKNYSAFFDALRQPVFRPGQPNGEPKQRPQSAYETSPLSLLGQQLAELNQCSVRPREPFDNQTFRHPLRDVDLRQSLKNKEKSPSGRNRRPKQ